MSNLDEFAAQEQVTEQFAKRELDLQIALTRAQRELDRAKRSKEDYMGALYNAVRDAFSGFTVAPVQAPETDRRRKGEEVCMPLFSDTQGGGVRASVGGVQEYNTEIMLERVQLYAQKIIEITEGEKRISRPVKHCVLPFLGDIVEGEDIFPGQVFQIDSGLYRQIVVSSEMLVSFIRTLLTSFDTVHAYGTIGNHGRIFRKGMSDPETNMDRLVYWIAAMALKDEPRVSWTIPEGQHARNWYNLVEIGNYRALAVHGDQFKGQLGIPWYGFQKKINGWAAGSIKEPFQDVLMGHWHQRALIPLNTRNVYVNGSFESYNTYAQENLGAMSDPSQWLLYVHPEKGRVTSSYGVDLA